MRLGRGCFSRRGTPVYALVDPPWSESGGGKIVRGAQRHYTLMKTLEICGLKVDIAGEVRHISDWAEENSHLYLWVTNNFLEDGLEVVNAWGFRYVTKITWYKGRLIQCGEEEVFQNDKPGTEDLLFCVRGTLPYKILETGKRAQGCTALFAPRTEHSSKPEGARSQIELVSYAPYLELFARRADPRQHWTYWGNQAEGSKPEEQTGINFAEGL